jgi:type II secretory ATPase GspE/PulE/Tfp pilus assembly ATPase PilB-like protein
MSSLQSAPLEFEPAGSTAEARKEVLSIAVDAPGFPSMCMMLVDLVIRRADVGVFDFTPSAVNIRYQIDGLWHPMAPLDRENGDSILAVLKHMAGMQYEERQARQDGSFKMLFASVKYKFRVVSQGVANGERVGVYVDFKRPPMEKLEELGIRPGLKNELVPLLESDQGLMISAAAPGEGYTSLWRGMLGACDRFLRDFYVLEEKSRVEPEVINVSSLTYDEKEGQNAFSDIRSLLLREPNVVAFAEIPNAEILNKIMELSENEEIMTLSRVHGKNAVDGLIRILALRPDCVRLAKNLKGVLSMRVLRKLCETCRVPFVPDNRLLDNLGIPPGRVRNLYKAFVFRPGEVDAKGQEIPPCPNCMGTGFKGRIGLFELLKLTDPVRNAIAAKIPVANLQETIANSGHVSMRDEAVLLVAKGTTSLEEVQRVLSK